MDDEIPVAAPLEGDYTSGGAGVFANPDLLNQYAPGNVLGQLGGALNDPRESYTNPDPTARRVGTDAAGNPVWQLIDSAGDTIEYAVDRGLGILGLRNVSAEEGTGRFAVPLRPIQPTTPATPFTDDTLSVLDLISNAVKGTNSDDDVLTEVYAPTEYNFNDNSVTDNSVRIEQNSAGLVQSVVQSIANLFKGGPPPVQAAPSVNPMDDALFGRATYPNTFSQGQTIDGSKSTPLGSSLSSAAIVKGFQNASNTSRLLVAGFIVLAGVVIWLLFRRRAQS